MKGTVLALLAAAALASFAGDPALAAGKLGAPAGRTSFRSPSQRRSRTMPETK